MRAIKSKGTELRPPTTEQVREVYSRVWSLYTRAYDWKAPDISDRREHSQRTAMRQHIRSWINTWDLRRLYNYEAHLLVENIVISLEEDADIQAESPKVAERRQTDSGPDNDDEPFITL